MAVVVVAVVVVVVDFFGGLVYEMTSLRFLI